MVTVPCKLPGSGECGLKLRDAVFFGVPGGVLGGGVLGGVTPLPFTRLSPVHTASQLYHTQTQWK